MRIKQMNTKSNMMKYGKVIIVCEHSNRGMLPAI